MPEILQNYLRCCHAVLEFICVKIKQTCNDPEELRLKLILGTGSSVIIQRLDINHEFKLSVGSLCHTEN